MTVRFLPARILVALPAFLLALGAAPGEVSQAAEGVYAATGFGPSNSALIVGEDALILVDAHHSAAAAAAALAAYREVVDLPLAAIIYTHGDRAHTSGAVAFTGRLSAPNIYARANFSLRGRAAGVEARLRLRRQKGALLAEPQRSATVIDPYPEDEVPGTPFLAPDKRFFGDRYRLRIAGVALELVAAPGETEDQLYVWLPERKVLIAGGNFYQTFPGGLSGLGDPAVDLEEWARSLDRMRAERPEVLIPGHTQPLFGASVIDRALADYAAALRFVRDATLRGIDAGLSPDELAASIRLPQELADSPVLAQTHGALGWAVRSVYARQMGWFDGRPGSIVPLPPRTLAWRLRELAASNTSLDEALDSALLLTDYRWAAYLADQMMQIEPSEKRHAERKASALEGMAQGLKNPQARNYLLSVAQELRLNGP